MSGPRVAYKGFDRDLKCRGYQYEVGQEYTHDGEIEMCGAGFHACPEPLSVLSYYPPAGSRFAVVEQDGKVIDGADKTVSSILRIKAEIGLTELIKAHVGLVWSRVQKTCHNHVKGDRSASSATGEKSVSTATGEKSVSTATGVRSGSTATGDCSVSSASGRRSVSSASGDCSVSSASGDCSVSSASGFGSVSSATGFGSVSSATGEKSVSTTTGDRSVSLTTGSYGSSRIVRTDELDSAEAVAVGVGYKNQASAPDGSWIVLAERNGDLEILCIKAAQAGRDVKPDTLYRLVGGEFMEVGP